MTLLSPLLALEVSVALAFLGAVCVSLFQNPLRAWRWGVVFTGLVLIGTLVTLVYFALAQWWNAPPGVSCQQMLLGQELLWLDELNAPLLPILAGVHFLTALTTGRTKMRRFSLSWSLASEGLRLTLLSCPASWLLVALLCLCTVPPYIELCNRGKPTRVYGWHMSLFVGLLVLGWACVDPDAGYQAQSAWATVPLLLALLIRCGTFPAHCWVTDWFEHASLGNALLFVTPLIGVYAVIRLVLPIAPDWVLQSIGLLSLLTAVYAAGMATIQQETRRFFAYLFLSHASLVLVGLELHTPISLTGALALWVSVSLSLAGFGLTLRALEARFGRLSMKGFCGLYNQAPALAVCFLLTGLTSVGFPGTLGFVATELLIDGAVTANLGMGLAVLLAGALNGIAIIRAYFLLFTGAHHVSTISLEIGVRERFAVLVLGLVILAGGLFPQPGIVSRYRAAMVVLEERETRAWFSSR